MSFEEAWVLPNDVETYGSDDLIARVRALLPAGIAVEISGEPDCRMISIEIPERRAEAIALKLAIDWDWREDLDPPREGDTYHVHVDVAHSERPLVRIYSNDGDNREAWPLVFSLASNLAEGLGAVREEDAPPLSDRIPLFIEPNKPTQKPN